jgi:hypothetical protein
LDQVQIDIIENRVREAIERAVDTARNSILGRSDRYWTLRIQQELTALGRDLGFRVRGARPRADDDGWDVGWLWDMTWIRPFGEHGLAEIVLALESEWSPKFDEILWDFQKLLVSRAHLRAMVRGAG